EVVSSFEIFVVLVLNRPGIESEVGIRSKAEDLTEVHRWLIRSGSAIAERGGLCRCGVVAEVSGNNWNNEKRKDKHDSSGKVSRNHDDSPLVVLVMKRSDGK